MRANPDVKGGELEQTRGSSASVSRPKPTAGSRLAYRAWAENVLAKTKMCLFHQQGCCSRGDACKFAHTASELREASSADTPFPRRSAAVTDTLQESLSAHGMEQLPTEVGQEPSGVMYGPPLPATLLRPSDYSTPRLIRPTLQEQLTIAIALQMTTRDVLEC